MMFAVFLANYAVALVGYWLLQLYILPRFGLFPLSVWETFVAVSIVFVMRLVGMILLAGHKAALAKEKTR